MYATRKRWYESLDVFLIRHRSLSLLQKKKNIYIKYIYIIIIIKTRFSRSLLNKFIDDFVRCKNRRERVMRREKERAREIKRAKERKSEREREECSSITKKKKKQA